jgi:hypothetical protein
MNTVINSTNRFNSNFLPERADTQSIYFPVSLQDVTATYEGQDGMMEDAFNPSLKAVVREDTGRILAVHGDGYNLIRNDELIPQFEDTLRKSSLDLTDMYVKTSLLDDGGAFVKEYRLPAHKIEVRVGDITEMVIKFKGSYNGRWASMFSIGGLRLKCTNGMVAINEFTKAYGRHTKNFNPVGFVDKLSASALIYLQNADIWHKWARKSISTLSITQLLTELELPESYNEIIQNQFIAECEESGHSTIWELFNALTAYSTHGKLQKNSQQAIVQDNREKRVSQIIHSQAFRRLAA